MHNTVTTIKLLRAPLHHLYPYSRKLRAFDRISEIDKSNIKGAILADPSVSHQCFRMGSESVASVPPVDMTNG